MQIFAPGQIIESTLPDRSSTRRTIHALLEKAGISKTLSEAGDQFQLSPAVACTVLFPPAGLAARTAADKSLVLQIQDGSASVLLMSDSAFTGEHWLMENNRDIHASVVVFDTQNADITGSGEFIAASHAFAAVRAQSPMTATAGQDRGWAAGLRKHGVVPFLQSETGAVTIDLSASQVSVTGFVNGQHLVRHID